MIIKSYNPANNELQHISKMEKNIEFYLNKEKLKSNFEKFSEIGQIYYPLKTNSNETILKELLELYKNSNNGFLITHISHYYKLLNLGVSTTNMCLVNVITNDEDVKFFYNNGIRYFTFDNMSSLRNFMKYADLNKTKIAIRLNIIEIFNTFSHLGANTMECQEMLSLLKKNKANDYGISFYLQKEVIPKGNPLVKMLDYIETNFKDLNMTFINIGGAIKPEDIDKYKLNEVKEKLGIEETIVEPGRYLVGNCGYMKTKIIKKKFSNVFIIQNGIYSGLLDALLYNKKFELFAIIEDELIKLKSEPFQDSKEIIICGASSDSGDRIGRFYINDKYYDKIDVNTTIVIDNALAYVEEFFMPLGGDLKIKYNIVS